MPIAELAALSRFAAFTTGAERAAPLITTVGASKYQVRAVVYQPAAWSDRNFLSAAPPDLHGQHDRAAKKLWRMSRILLSTRPFSLPRAGATGLGSKR